MTGTAQTGRLSALDRASGNGSVAGVTRGTARESPATPTQSALWFIHQMDPAGSAYNIPLAFDLAGPLDVAALRAALETLVARHEILRTVYAERGDDLVLRTFDALAQDAFFEQHTWPGGNGTGEDERSAMRALAAEEAARPFLLGRDAPLRARLWSFERDRHLLTLVFHHIAVDQPAVGAFVDQLAALYDAHRVGRAPDDPGAAAPRFTDFARERADRAHTRREHDDGLSSWIARLEGFSGVLNLPTVQDGAGARAAAGAPGDVHRFAIPHEVVDAVRTFAEARSVPAHAVYLAAFHALLHQHAGQEDIIVGMPLSDRGDDERLRDVVGCFINTLPIAVRVDGALGFTALAASVHEALRHADAHRDVPFEAIVEAVRPRREPGLNPIYQVGFAFEEALRTPGFDGIHCEDIEVHSGGAMYDLHLCLADAPTSSGRGRMHGVLWYDTGRFDADFARRLMDRYAHLLPVLLARPDAPLDQFPIATPQELAELATWHGVERNWPSTATTLAMFAEQARGHPHDIAVIAHSGGMTYAELLMRARQLSAMLTARGVNRGDLVGVCMTRDLGMIIAVLGVMGAGAAYVPLDPEYPADRLAYIAREARLRVLVAEPQLAAFEPPDGCESILLEPDGGGVPDVHAARDGSRRTDRGSVDCEPGPDDIMYVIFTSGSTGRPKGVSVPHACVSNFLHAVAEAPGFRSTDRLLAVTTLSFDIAVLELFLPLTTGGTVVLADSEQTHDGDALVELLAEHDVNVMQATPSTWRMLIEAGWEGVGSGAGGNAGRNFRALCGGEALPSSLASAISARVTELWNLYGPTETTVWSMRERVRPGSPISIGRPLENTTCHVLSPSRQLLPVGIPGELYIGGAGVTAGYLHRPDLTIDRFIANPFGHKAGRLYRTGDKVVRMSDGRLLYLGRLDNQVKVNGHRVELGEIESVLEELPQVRQAAAMVSAGDDGDARLVAYVVAADGGSIFGSEIRRALRERLPDYMVPSIVLPLDAMPLTPNGKVDRKALPDPLAGRREVEFVGPRTEAERAVAGVWRELLGVERVGVLDNFFEIGGHSLLAIRATARLGDRVGVRPDPRAMFFQTLEQVAASLQGASDRESPMRATAS